MATSKVFPLSTALPGIFYEDPEPVEDGMQQASIIVEIAYLLTAFFRKQPNVFVSAGGFGHRTTNSRKNGPSMGSE